MRTTGNERGKKMNRKSGIMVLVAFFVFAGMGIALAGQIKTAEDIERISPEMTYEKVTAGDALLVCSYSDGKCKDMLVKGALLRGELESRLSTLPMDQEIIFYCA